MKVTRLTISAAIALLLAGLAQGQSGFPTLPPINQTGELQQNPGVIQFTFIVAGDNRPAKQTSTQPKTLSRILNDAQRFNPAFFLWCGDTISGHVADSATLQDQYSKFIAALAQAKVPVFNAPGNHEMDTIQKDPHKVTVETPDPRMAAYYLQYMFSLPPNSSTYGAFNYGNSRFIALNTEEVAPAGMMRLPGPTVASGTKLDPGYVSPEQIALLTQDLAANQDKAHIFVFMHHPIKPNKKGSALDPTIAGQLEQLFQNPTNTKFTNVSYVLAAHEHLYYNANSNTLTPPQWQPGSAPIYLVTAGAGAPLDKCGTNTGYCGAFYHYLVVTVNGPTVSVQVVALPSSLKKPTTKKGGKK